MKIISKQLLDKWYAEEYSKSKQYSVYGKPKPVMRDFFKILEKNNVKSVLEIGCGDGRNIIELAKKGMVVTGLDLFGEKALNQRAKKEKVDIKFIKGAISKTNFAKKTYDAVISSEVFHLMQRKHVVKAIESMKKATNKNGFIYISILSNLVRKFLHNGKEFRYEKQAYYTNEESRNLLKNKFKNWKIIKLGKFHDTQNWPLKKGNYPIKPYHWSGDYIHIIAQRKYLESK